MGNPLKRPMVHGRHEEIAHRAKHMSLGMVDEEANAEKLKNSQY